MRYLLSCVSSRISGFLSGICFFLLPASALSASSAVIQGFRWAIVRYHAAATRFPPPVIDLRRRSPIITRDRLGPVPPPRRDPDSSTPQGVTMTPRTPLAAALTLVAALGLAACGEGNGNAGNGDANDTDAGEAQAPSVEQSRLSGAYDKATETAGRVTQQATERTEQALDGLSSELSERVEQAQRSGAELADETQQKLVTEAEAIYEQAKSLLDQDNLELAQQALAQLEEIKNQLPESWQQKIDDLAQQVRSAVPG